MDLESLTIPEADSHRVLLETYWPSERRAIIVFRHCLQCDLERDIAIEEAVAFWERGAAAEWRREKMRIDGQKQLEEIERHKYVVSQRVGHDIGWERAALDWIDRYAADWRRWWEEQREACPPLARPATERW